MFSTILVHKNTNIELFFFSFLYKKFINKVFLAGNKFKAENFLYNVIYLLSILHIFYKPFFFHFYALFEKLKLSYTFKSRQRGRKIYKIPVPIFYLFRYKYALKVSRKIMNKYLKLFNIKNKIKFFFSFLFFNFVLYKKNFLTVHIKLFKRNLKNNRIFLH